MGLNVTQKLMQAHLVSGSMTTGDEVAISVDQTLTPDSGGTMVMLELEALGAGRARTDVSVQYVDHNLLQADAKNAEDHNFLRSAAQRFGLWFSRAGNGVSHPTHMERFGVPGRSLVGADSHTCGAGALGMFAVGQGGTEVALAIAGEPIFIRMPEIWGVELTGALPDWLSAKDIILEMLRRHGVDGAVNRIIEYHGPGLAGLTAMDRHVVANMGAELGATTTVFPSDSQVHRFLRAHHRESDFREIRADTDATYDLTEQIDLSTLEPLIALPSSPGRVVPVREVAGREVEQVVVGSSANPGLRDFAMVAALMSGRHAHPRVSFDINPTSRQVLADLTRMGGTVDLIAAGARLHQAGCLGCIGMGQAPAAGRTSLRTFPRNFPGRSGTPEDAVYLCSPETAAAAALTGEITDPRDLPDRIGIRYPRIRLPGASSVSVSVFEEPSPVDDADRVELDKGPNIGPFPVFDSLPNRMSARVLLTLGDDVSTDEILPGGSQVLPFRSNVPRLADFTFHQVDPDYVVRAKASREKGGHIIVAGDNYGQGSSREHAAITPRYLGLQAVVAKSFARIHGQNLINFGVLALELVHGSDHTRIHQGDLLVLDDVRDAVSNCRPITIRNVTRRQEYPAVHTMSQRQAAVLLAGGLIPWYRTNTPGLEGATIRPTSRRRSS